MPDVDLDFPDRTKVLDIIKHVPATIDHTKKHNTGVYCQEIPINPLTGFASIPYEESEARGYFKIDFLNVSAYVGVRNEDHIKELLAVEPLWDLLYEKDVCDQLFHINGYHTLLADLKPTSISELAMVLALIRPGKRHLLPVCKEKGFESIKDEIWTRTEDAYYFKKSHAIGYSHLIVMQLNLICEKLSYGFS